MTEKNTNAASVDENRLGRRDAVRQLGKFAAYAAPFTVLALSAKATTATGGGFHAQSAPTHK